jgi:hypothetical protein
MARRPYHHSDAEKVYNRIVWAAERRQEELEQERAAAALRRDRLGRLLRAACFALGAAALLAVIGIVVRSFL